MVFININKKSVIVVAGPTASGKTSVGISLAKELNGEVISADSMQIYKGLDITTAKPTESEMQGIPHHLISLIEMDEEFSVADYVKLATNKIDEVSSRGKIPIIVGGTGLYINSLIDGVNFDNAVTDGAIRDKLINEAELLGKDEMHRRLMEIDPETALKVSQNNISRVIRALEIFEITGKKFSEYKIQSKSNESPYNVCMIGLNFTERQDLYDRINKRVDIMLEKGMLKECEQVYRQGNLKLGTACQAIGYKELLPYFDGREDLDVCISKIKQYSRNYAKRQLTWFRRDERINWVKLDNVIIFDKIINTSKKIVAKSKIM